MVMMNKKEILQNKADRKPVVIMTLPFVPAHTFSTEGSIGIYPIQSSLQISGQDKFQS